MAEQPLRELGRIEHGHLARRQRPRVQPLHRAARGLLADLFRRLEVLGMPAHGVPIVALERVLGLREHAAAHRVRARRVRADEAVRVRVDALADAARDGSALGVRDARVERARRVLAAQRELRRLIDVDVPRKVEIETLLLARHQLGVGETGVLVGRREAADAHRLADGVLDARRREIRRARTALALVAIHGDREPAIALPLDGFELAHAHGHGQSFLVAGADFGLIGALPARERDCLRSDGLQRFGNRVLIHAVHDPRVRSEF